MNYLYDWRRAYDENQFKFYILNIKHICDQVFKIKETDRVD